MLLPFIVASAPSLNYCVDLRKDASFFKKIINCQLKQDMSAPESENPELLKATVQSGKGVGAAITAKGFDMATIYDLIK
jgi:hypothetical protein